MTRPLHTIFNILALSAVIYFSVDTFYRIAQERLTPNNDGSWVTYKIAGDIQKRNNQPKDFMVINKRNIFGSLENSMANSISTQIDSLKLTDLKIILLGTVAGNPKNTIAIIEDTEKRKQWIYKIGDSVQNAIIKLILRGKVILSVGGKDEILLMREITALNERNSSSRSKSSKSERNIQIKRSDLENALTDVNLLLSQAQIRPHYQDGQGDGLTIAAIRAGSIYQKMGLNNGDIVQSVSGQPIRSMDDVLLMYNNLKSGSNVSLQIKRSGKQINLNYDIR